MLLGIRVVVAVTCSIRSPRFRRRITGGCLLVAWCRRGPRRVVARLGICSQRRKLNLVTSSRSRPGCTPFFNGLGVGTLLLRRPTLLPIRIGLLLLGCRLVRLGTVVGVLSTVGRWVRVLVGGMGRVLGGWRRLLSLIALILLLSVLRRRRSSGVGRRSDSPPTIRVTSSGGRSRSRDG